MSLSIVAGFRPMVGILILSDFFILARLLPTVGIFARCYACLLPSKYSEEARSDKPVRVESRRIEPRCIAENSVRRMNALKKNYVPIPPNPSLPRTLATLVLPRI